MNRKEIRQRKYKKSMILRRGYKTGKGQNRIRYAKSYVFYNCDGCGCKGFQGRYCPKCGLEAEDWKKIHTINV